MSPVEIQAQIEIFVTAFRTLPRMAQHEILERLQHATVVEPTVANEPEIVPAHNAAALRLLHVWLADDSGYDEATWPLLKQTLEANRLSDRSLFDATTPDA